MVPPHVTDMEIAVLGAIMLEVGALSLVSDILCPDSFYKESHSVVYAAMLDLSASNSPVDTLTVTGQLRKNKTLEIAGGPLAVTMLTNKVASSANIEHHARAIQEAYALRQIIAAGGKIAHEAYQPGADPFDLMASLDGSLQSLGNQLAGGSAAPEFKEQIRETVKHIEIAAQNRGVTGVPSKFSPINRIMGGYQNGDLIIVAGRPGMGKTSYVLTEVRHISSLGIPAAFFSLEMPYRQLNQRMLSAESENGLESIQKGRLDNVGWGKVNSAHGRMREWPLHIDDSASLSITQLRAKARRLKNKKGIKILFVDYLQLMTGKGQNREQEVSDISRGLKALAKSLEIPVVALAQLSRASEKRGTSAIPILSDLRESGSIEQDADVVKFLYRPEYYDITEDAHGESTAGKAMVIIAKHRNGALDKVKLNFDAPFCAFDNLNEAPY